MKIAQVNVFIGGLYKHYKGNSYRLIGIAKDSEDGVLRAVYQNMSGEYEIWSRQLDMFVGITKNGETRFAHIGGGRKRRYEIAVNDDFKSFFADCIWEKE